MELMMKYDSLCVKMLGSSAEFQRIADALDCLLDILHSEKRNKLIKTALEDLYFELRYISLGKITNGNHNTNATLSIPLIKAGYYGYISQRIAQSPYCSNDITNVLLTLKELFYDDLAKSIGDNNHNRLLLLYQNMAHDDCGWLYLKWLEQYIVLTAKKEDAHDQPKNIFYILASSTTTYEQFHQHIHNFKHSQESDELYADEVIPYINSKLLV